MQAAILGATQLGLKAAHRTLGRVYDVMPDGGEAEQTQAQVLRDVAQNGALQAYLTRYAPDGQLDVAIVDMCIAQIDRALCHQLNAILHHPAVQALESAWRGLHMLVTHVPPEQNIVVQRLHATLDELASDFDDCPELPKTGLYRLVYSSEYGVFGGAPYGVVVGNYAFSPRSRDITLLSQMAAICAMAHAPLITNAGPSFFGSDAIDALPRLRDMPAQLDGPQMQKWQRFRDSEQSRYVGLCLPRFLLRLPYTHADKSVRLFNFEEDVAGATQHYLWGHASTAMACCIATSFAKYRWCPHIVGPSSGGAAARLIRPTFASFAATQHKLPTEVLITEDREFELSEAGFIALTYRSAQGEACFLSAQSAQRPDRPSQLLTKPHENGFQNMQARLGAQLPYLFILTRLAHYIKVMQRESIGRNQSRTQLQHAINVWLGQYVADMQDPAPSVRAQRPLRRAKVTVEDVLGQPEWYRCRLEVMPHIKYMGAAFTLSLVGRLDKT